MRAGPKRSESHALNGTTTPSTSVYEVAIHWIWSVVAPNAFCIVGIATLTMLVSRIDMNMPTMSTTSGRPQPPDGAGGCGAAGARSGSTAAGAAAAGAGAARCGAVVTGRSSTDIT